MPSARNVVRLGVASAFAVACALQAGCIPYAYPNLMSVPAVRLDATLEPITAFRVEVKGQVADLGSSTDDYALSRIDCGPGERLPAQSDFSLEYGFYVVGGALEYPVHWGKTLLVRLYRPGFETVELREGEEAKVGWMPALDLAAKERAIDDLLAEPAYSSFAQARRRSAREQAGGAAPAESVPQSLPPGSRSAAHHAALVFTASEYDRLIVTAKPPEADAERLRKKAAAVRARAAQ
jgi:hypothetical protein